MDADVSVSDEAESTVSVCSFETRAGGVSSFTSSVLLLQLLFSSFLTRLNVNVSMESCRFATSSLKSSIALIDLFLSGLILPLSSFRAFSSSSLTSASSLSSSSDSSSSSELHSESSWNSSYHTSSIIMFRMNNDYDGVPNN
jgi:hypothetical protein